MVGFLSKLSLIRQYDKIAYFVSIKRSSLTAQRCFRSAEISAIVPGLRKVLSHIYVTFLSLSSHIPALREVEWRKTSTSVLPNSGNPNSSIEEFIPSLDSSLNQLAKFMLDELIVALHF